MTQICAHTLFSEQKHIILSNYNQKCLSIYTFQSLLYIIELVSKFILQEPLQKRFYFNSFHGFQSPNNAILRLIHAYIKVKKPQKLIQQSIFVYSL